MPTPPRTTRWAPVRRGLVVDPEGKHLRRLGRGLGLYLYCLQSVDWQSGIFARKVETIASQMGFPERTIRRWMGRLVAEGYIAIRKNGRALVITVLRWTPIRPRLATQTGQSWPVRPDRFDRDQIRDAQKSKQPCGEIDAPERPINISSTKSFNPDSSDDRLELLARDLADGLEDLDHTDRYRKLARLYPEDMLRRCLGEARAVPAHRVRKSRVAIFLHHLKRYAR